VLLRPEDVLPDEDGVWLLVEEDAIDAGGGASPGTKANAAKASPTEATKTSMPSDIAPITVTMAAAPAMAIESETSPQIVKISPMIASAYVPLSRRPKGSLWVLGLLAP